MAWPLFHLLLGLLLLYAGAEALVHGSAAFARRLGLSPLVIGLTVVAFGTSTPELAVSAKAALDGMGGIAIGNVVGSNIANIALVIGAAALVSPIEVHAQAVRRDIPVVIAASLLTLAFAWHGHLSRLEGGILLAGLIAYLAYTVVLARRERARTITGEFQAEVPEELRSVWNEVLLIAGGIALLVVGADRVVAGAVAIAGYFKVSKAVIALTVIAFGTSLPELATSIVAAYKRHSDIAIGNIIGSNIFNLLGILGITAVIAPVDATGIRHVDWLVMIALSLLLLRMARVRYTLRRWEGADLLVIYVGYIAFLAFRS
jgi:cation:H+ antiporter